MGEDRWTASDLVAAFRRVQLHLCDAQENLGRLDGLAGDGDLGVTLRRGFDAVTSSLVEGHVSSPSDVLRLVSAILAREAPSTMGTLLSRAFREASQAVEGADDVGRDEIVSMLEAAAQSVAQAGDASAGDRTVLDAMLPGLAGARSTESGAGAKQTLVAAAQAAARGAEATSMMEPQLGRAAWIGARVVGSPDAGAVAWSMILSAMASE